jgi:hypothetical protein
MAASKPFFSGISGVGVDDVLNVIIAIFGRVQSAAHISKEAGDTVGRILNSCLHVKMNVVATRTLNLPWIFLENNILTNLILVSKIAEKCETNTRSDRVKYMPKAMTKLGKLEKVEQEMEFVLALVTAIDAEQAYKSTERTVDLLPKQTDVLAAKKAYQCRERPIDRLAKQTDVLAQVFVSMCTELESDRAMAYSQRFFERTHNADLPAYFDFDPGIKYIELAQSVLMGFHDDIEQIESLARFLEFNKTSLEALGYSTDVEESKLQETLLNAKVLSTEESNVHSCHQYRLDLFHGTTAISSLRLGSLFYDSMNPVLCQVILLFAQGKTPIHLVDFLKSHPSNLWFNCVFNPEGDLSKPIVFEVDASHTETMLHFEQVYRSHCDARDVFLLAIGTPPQGGHAEDRSRTVLESRERTFWAPRRIQRSNRMTGSRGRSSARRRVLRRIFSRYIDPGLELEPGTTRITFADEPGGLKLISAPCKGFRIYVNQISGGFSAFQVGVGWDILPPDAITREVQNATGENVVTIVRSFTEYLRCTVWQAGIRLSVFQKITTLHELLENNDRELCIQGNCILHGIHPGFDLICDDPNPLFSEHSGCSVRDIPGVLAIPVKVESPGGFDSVVEDVAQQFLHSIAMKGLPVPEYDLQLFDLFRRLFESCRENLPCRVLVVFTDDGMRISVCYQHRPPEDGSRSCVWNSIPYEPGTGWVMHEGLRTRWKSQEPFRICGPSHCLWTLVDSDIAKHFGTIAPLQ